MSLKQKEVRGRIDGVVAVTAANAPDCDERGRV